MSKKMEITITIKDETGNSIITSTSERIVPYIEEIEEQGFRAAFHELETAVLEGRKEASDHAVSEYLGTMSQKKRQMSLILEKQSQGNGMEYQVNWAKSKR